MLAKKGMTLAASTATSPMPRVVNVLVAQEQMIEWMAMPVQEESVRQYKRSSSNYSIKKKAANSNEIPISPQRTSWRNAAMLDQDLLDKATKLKAHKNLDPPKDKGNQQASCSFNTFDNCNLFNKISSVGVLLGSSSERINS